ncbi:MAG: addiction module protein [Victivallales bacterium]
MSIAEIRGMSTIERIQTMEILWDMLSSEQENIKSPEWHSRVLKERQRKIAKGKMKFISLDQLKDHFRK